MEREGEGEGEVVVKFWVDEEKGWIVVVVRENDGGKCWVRIV